MAILSFISFGIYQATVETYRLRDSLAAEGDFYSGIRLSLNIFQQDIELLYSPIIGVPAPPTTAATNLPPGIPPAGNAAVQAAQQAALLAGGDLGAGSKFWSPAISLTGLRPSHFVGAAEKMNFISTSHMRIYKDAPESELVKIEYELRKDESNTEHPDTSVLVRTENPNAFNLDDSSGTKDPFSHSYSILHGIKKMTLTYYQRDGNTWKVLKSWDSDHEETRNIYPDMIQIDLELLGRKSDKFTGKFKFRPEIPLNGLDSST